MGTFKEDGLKLLKRKSKRCITEFWGRSACAGLAEKRQCPLLMQQNEADWVSATYFRSSFETCERQGKNEFGTP